MIHARPNSNGNEPKHFRRVAQQLVAVQLELENAIHEAAMNVVHGRNYQTVEDPEGGRTADIEVLDALRLYARGIQAIALDIYQASGD